ncbi:MAG: tRNA (N6-isopentenyl adenosine(37)-C2)-methylthiotransferase MiaB [Bacteroidales bacterium]|jgi:tRNA-2-methylthio-N6-dimethylallyladenosine synthase|nr:tRNA (N6-isopentenyl adenosine(37)-C2)-methylthiotransferase MiaB [Bacteroidales bacterium]MDD4703280.1 tRNA (N6-isopentenyl adenosine(37)-C2)-methylthiotransferase MiaB [Bacteroidales bacterium]MDX9798907.1 tRNA (N6-isopentenyl adenosine(37)-C2)-methylthiotransferase MiaB [Bacteroidales bacterium]
MNKVFIETYGCQMNQADSEVVLSILGNEGYELTTDIKLADLILVNTCSIRDNAEQRVKSRLMELESLKKKNSKLRVGVLGCMAERLKEELFEQNKVVDLVVGPDGYRDIPVLLSEFHRGQRAFSVMLSDDETYSEIKPVRIDTNGVSAFVSIMRGCENFCSYCVVPYTRGKERSRDYESILDEVRDLFEKGFREVTLLGQNVNSYLYENDEVKIDFSKLMEMVALVSPLLRVRFSTSHPKDISENLVKVIAKYSNICKYIHLPIQSGSANVLKRMNRKYTPEQYLYTIDMIRKYIPDCSISTDIIAGFCGETLEDHNETLEIMSRVGYDYAFMFHYSERPNTLAAKKYPDDVPLAEKKRRLDQIITLQNELSHKSNMNDIGKKFEVLIEGESKRNKEEFFGRTSQNKVVVFNKENNRIGDYVNVKITSCTSATLMGEKVN